MQYHGVELTLDNIWEFLDNPDTAIMDEVRLAVMDNTPIGKYIDLCGTDDYKLKQIRMALRENFPSEYLHNALTADCIKELRYMYAHNIDLGIVEPYLDLRGEVLIYILKAVHKGADISSIDFNKIKYSLIPVVARGLLHGYPLAILQERYDTFLTEAYVTLLLPCLQVGVDIKPFVEHEWSMEILTMLTRAQVDGADINYLLQFITPKSTKGFVRAVLDAQAKGVAEEDLRRLCLRDEDGYSIYNEFQVSALTDAILSGRLHLIGDTIFNPTLSDKVMRDMIANTPRVFG